MKNRGLIIGAIAVATLIIVIVLILLIVNLNNKQEENNIGGDVESANTIMQEVEEQVEEEPIVIYLETEKEPEPEPVKDAATLTQEVYDINDYIGTLNIPKTGLNTQIYSRVSASQMEVTPCFLYTTGGLNEKGFTLFVGHNRENGLLFSDNPMLEEGDEFYFTDLNGAEKKYTVFSKFETDSDDVSFYNNPVDSPVIAMQCCVSPTNEEQVIIVMGKAEN